MVDGDVRLGAAPEGDLVTAVVPPVRHGLAAGGTDSFALVTVSGGATYTGVPNGTYRDAVTGDVRTVSGGTLSVGAPGKGDLRVYVLDGPGKIGADGPYLK